MILLETLEEALVRGYDVLFTNDGFNLYISIQKKTYADHLPNTTSLPFQDHVTEERVSDCIKFMLNREENETRNDL